MKQSQIVTLVLVIAAIVTILTYLGLKPTKDDPMPETEKINVLPAEQSGGTTVGKVEENIDVKSYNQSGGITAGKITVGRQPRKVTPAVIAQLEKLLPSNKDTAINIDAVWGNQEAFQFAEAIKSYLESQGRKVKGVDQVSYSKPVLGQSITEGGTRIRIGSME